MNPEQITECQMQKIFAHERCKPYTNLLIRATYQNEERTKTI